MPKSPPWSAHRCVRAGGLWRAALGALGGAVHFHRPHGQQHAGTVVRGHGGGRGAIAAAQPGARARVRRRRRRRGGGRQLMDCGRRCGVGLGWLARGVGAVTRAGCRARRGLMWCRGVDGARPVRSGRERAGASGAEPLGRTPETRNRTGSLACVGISRLLEQVRRERTCVLGRRWPSPSDQTSRDR